MESELVSRLDRIEQMLAVLVQAKVVKDWYTTAEIAEMLDRDPYTVREWARLGRIRADKRAGGRGKAKEWMVSRGELDRIRNHGLLPLR